MRCEVSGFRERWNPGTVAGGLEIMLNPVALPLDEQRCLKLSKSKLMPTIFYWGEDEFAINQAVKNLQAKILDPNWIQFNYDKINGDRNEAIIEA
ncbi:MAG: hypothetical protein ACKO90_03010, partial [Microcystis panniformis]